MDGAFQPGSYWAGGGSPGAGIVSSPGGLSPVGSSSIGRRSSTTGSGSGVGVTVGCGVGVGEGVLVGEGDGVLVGVPGVLVGGTVPAI
jgi:hypothetical protein